MYYSFPDAVVLIYPLKFTLIQLFIYYLYSLVDLKLLVIYCALVNNYFILNMFCNDENIDVLYKFS